MSLLQRICQVIKPQPKSVGWIPVDAAPWRIICQDGSFMRDADGETLKFASDVDAQACLAKVPKL